jgi:excisionase family DNA binding protein
LTLVNMATLAVGWATVKDYLGGNAMEGESWVLTVSEAARLLRVGRNHLYECVRRGEIPVLRLGRRILVPRSALQRMLERGLSDDLP